MKPTFFYPHPLLKNYISHYMVVDLKLGCQPYNEYIPFPPTPQHCIHFYPADPIKTERRDGSVSYSPESLVVGPQATRVNLSMGRNHVLLSVAFHPGGLYRLLRIPMVELYDQSFNAVDLLGPSIREINERLKEAVSYLEMKTIVENYLIKKLPPLPLTGFERSLRLMLDTQNSLTIDQTANYSCLSLRQFERKSKELVGFSPKFFQRLIRFSQAYRLKINQPIWSWTRICYASRYYDQMHLIRDFKEFAGANPEALAREIQASPIQVQDHLKI